MISVDKFSDDECKVNDYDTSSPKIADGFNNHLSLANLQSKIISISELLVNIKYFI